MHILNYTAAFEISDYETVQKHFEESFVNKEDALEKAYELCFGCGGPIEYYNVRIDGEPLFVPIPSDNDLPF